MKTEASPQQDPEGREGASTLSSRDVAVPRSEPVPSLPRSGERPRVGQRYEILGLIGSGGMGTVYRARDVELDEIVAVKVLRAEVADAPGVVDRFRREAKLARRVTHHNVARVFDIGEDAGERFLTMELVDGESLGALVSRRGALDLSQALALAAAIAAGLEAAHAAGVVHRDLKPENVLLTRGGRVVVTDFGIARALHEAGDTGLTARGDVFGTPAYMAPEQIEGAPDVDARADVYALGTLLYELLTGQPAWVGPSPLAIASARMFRPPPDPRLVAPRVPAALAELVMRCMARRPDDRPSSMAEVSAALAEAARESDPAAPASARAAPDPGVTWSTNPTPTAPRAPPATKTVAVLPFRNIGAPDDDYLADELTDDLIDELSMTGDLKVCARGASARLRGADARTAGRELGVQLVVDGSVRRASDRVRVTARAISVADGFQLWAKRIERPAAEVLAINDEVARAIAEALSTTGGAARESSSDAAAIDLYIRGRREYRKFWPDHQRRAIALFEQAVAISPDDPTILAALSMAHARLAFFAGEARLAEVRRIAERAVAAGNLGEAHLALGSVLLQVGDAKGALREMRQAVARGPGVAEAHAAMGRLLVELGRVDEGVRRLDAALDLDPHVPLAVAALVRTHALLGAWDKAVALFPKFREAEGDFSFWVTHARLSLWRRERGLPGASLDEAPGGTGLGLPRAMLAVLDTGRWPDAMPSLDTIASLPDVSARRRLMYFQMYVEMAGYLDDHDPMLDALGRAADGGLIDVAWLERCPLFDPARGDPRFSAIHVRVLQRAEDALERPRTA